MRCHSGLRLALGAIAFALERWAVTWNRCRVHGVLPVIAEIVVLPQEQSKKTQFQPTEAKDARRHLPTPHLTHLVPPRLWPRSLYITPLNRCRATTE
jgi:hypothetical protein